MMTQIKEEASDFAPSQKDSHLALLNFPNVNTLDIPQTHFRLIRLISVSGTSNSLAFFRHGNMYRVK